MARRKNTADCREVLRKVFEAEIADGPQAGQGKQGKGLTGDGQSPAAGESRINPGVSERQAKPLLGRRESDSPESVHRHGGIRSTAPGVAGASPRFGQEDLPGGARFRGGATEPLDAEPEAVSIIEARDPGPEFNRGRSPGGEPDGLTGAEEDCSQDAAEESPAGEDPAAIRMAGGAASGSGGRGESPGDDFRDGPVETDRDGVEPSGGGRALFPRLLNWFLRDDSLGVFGQSVQVRASTMILFGLAVAIVVGLLGLYFNIDREEGTLAGRLLDERQALQGAAGAGGGGDGRTSLPAGRRGSASKPGDSVRTSANPAPRVGRPGGGTIPVRPLWSRNSTSGTGVSGVGRTPIAARPPVRKVEGPAATRSEIFVTTSATRWLRVRDLMGKEECAKLLDHLKGLQQHLREKNGCADGSIACKELKSRVKERHGEQLYAVDIGPFSSWNFAQQASAVLKEATRKAPWVFHNKKDYFAESYPRKP